MTISTATNRLKETVEILTKAREDHSSVLVAYSGGKDSEIVLDMCRRVFDRVEAFHMEYSSNIKAWNGRIEEFEREKSLKIHRVPHIGLSVAIKYGQFCNPYTGLGGMPDMKLSHVYEMARHKSGIRLIATGARRKDSQWRKRNLDSVSKRVDPGYLDVIYPVVGWSRVDVAHYYAAHGMKMPDRVEVWEDFGVPSILWLWDNARDDFWELCKSFPYLEAIVRRREFYGNVHEKATVKK